jgi:hypothetical protein
MDTTSITPNSLVNLPPKIFHLPKYYNKKPQPSPVWEEEMEEQRKLYLYNRANNNLLEEDYSQEEEVLE